MLLLRSDINVSVIDFQAKNISTWVVFIMFSHWPGCIHTHARAKLRCNLAELNVVKIPHKRHICAFLCVYLSLSLPLSFSFIYIKYFQYYNHIISKSFNRRVNWLLFAVINQKGWAIVTNASVQTRTVGKKCSVSCCLIMMFIQSGFTSPLHA